MRIDAIYDRRSIRKYKPEIPDREIIAKVLDAARVAPSARNRQPWKYLVYTGEAKERILSTMQFALMSRGVVNSADAQMRQVIAGAVHTLRIMKNAPVVIFVVNPEGDNPYKEISGRARVDEILDTVSVGASIQNLLIAAQAEGLGTLWIGYIFQTYEELRREIPGTGQLVSAIALGYADEEPEARPRKALEDIVEFYD